MCLETDHSVLWVGLFMGHLQQLLRSANPHLTEHIEPPTAQKESQKLEYMNPLGYKSLLLFSVHLTLRPPVTQQTPDRSSHPSQCSERSPFRDYPRSPCKQTNSANVWEMQLLSRKQWRRDCVCFFFLLEILLGCSDVDGSLQLLLAVVVVVHQLAVPQYKPAHLPVSEVERDTMKTSAKKMWHYKWYISIWNTKRIKCLIQNTSYCTYTCKRVEELHTKCNVLKHFDCTVIWLLSLKKSVLFWLKYQILGWGGFINFYVFILSHVVLYVILFNYKLLNVLFLHVPGVIQLNYHLL